MRLRSARFPSIHHPFVPSLKLQPLSLFLILALGACREGSSPIPLPSAPRQSVSVYGQITAASSHAPVADARIEITEVMDDAAKFAISDANGMFRVPNLRSDFSHWIVVSRDGFQRAEQWITLNSGELETRVDFRLVERLPALTELSGRWEGTVSIENDDQDDQAPCPRSERIAGTIEHSGSVVTANLSGACNRALHFDGTIAAGSLSGEITLAIGEETFRGAATGTASTSDVTLNATLRSPLGHTIYGLSVVLAR